MLHNTYMATSSISKSAYESAVDTLRTKHNIKLKIDDVICGPLRFIQQILERSDAFKARTNIKPFLSLRVGELPNMSFLATISDPWHELCILYIRAFQSVRSRNALKAFVIALGDGRFSESPVDLSRIKPEWCDETHAMYAYCWRRISKSDHMNKRNQIKRDKALGRTLMSHILRANGLHTNKTVIQIKTRLSAHEPTVELIGRFSRITREGNTAALMNDVIAHAKAMYASGDIDFARLAREGMQFAKTQGVDPTASMSQISGLLRTMKTATKQR